MATFVSKHTSNVLLMVRSVSARVVSQGFVLTSVPCLCCRERLTRCPHRGGFHVMLRVVRVQSRNSAPPPNLQYLFWHGLACLFFYFEIPALVSGQRLVKQPVSLPLQSLVWLGPFFVLFVSPQIVGFRQNFVATGAYMIICSVATGEPLRDLATISRSAKHGDGGSSCIRIGEQPFT